MGCPDWPKCFGQWVPPTNEAQLPDDYEEVFVQGRVEKNERLAGFLEVLGLNQVADQLRNEPGIQDEQPFNAVKTWIEYINRLIGVVIGLLIMGTLVTSIPYLKTDSRIFILSLAAFVLVVFQGWLGSVVVSTNLLPGMVSIHMLLAIVIVGVLINAVFLSFKQSIRFPVNISSVLVWVLGLAVVISIVQILLGTQVREAIDGVAATMNYSGRESWIAETGSIFPIHRSYSILIVLINGFILYRLWKNRFNKIVFRSGVGLALVIGLSVITGMIMAYLGIPKFAQPIHLLLGTALFGVQFILFLTLRNARSHE
jgi:cytochrome c oxidase assembly protein subunit 15